MINVKQMSPQILGQFKYFVFYERRNIVRKTYTLSLPQISHSTRNSVDHVDAIILSLRFVILFHRHSQKSKEM